jgi:FkbM family methyltransferase
VRSSEAANNRAPRALGVVASVGKRTINATLRKFGIEIRRLQQELPRPTLRGALNQVRRLDLCPATVIDVGAADGTLELYETFPQARHILIEPLVEFTANLEELKARFVGLQYTIAAAGREPGEILLNVHRDLYGSSLHLEHEAGNNGQARSVPVVRVDDLVSELPAPFLMKVDVQGGELDVLAGSHRTLQRTECIVLETSLFEFYERGPQFRDIVEYMHQQGFALYDIVDIQYRPLDGAASQVDAVFVPWLSQLRRDHGYATPEQRAHLNQQFEETLRRVRR